MKKSFAAFAALLVAAAAGAAGGKPQGGEGGKKLLTPEIAATAFRRAGGVFRLTWRPGTDEVAFLKREGSGGEEHPALVLYDAATGKEKEVPEPPGEHHLNLASYQWSPKGDKLLVEGGSDLWLMDLAGGAPRRLTDDPRPKEDATFSPAGDRVAFVEDNNIYTVDLATGLQKKLTTDGAENLMNG